ncbi:flagellar basal body-associated protein FliL [Marinobacterium nitratireducens]|uniref:Flagellar protein FliL n=1 Tax=Marinobacterium nitratireducens TaxID=518897 RepID=A0A917ZL63_9GAMM|nr:flagellar basal body-associated FliL family protein [Marinobacterium nitratireducens]GGO84995.1 flagellar basal body-associated protein FliL [Marinobacterium nitratireducens]
MADGSDAADGKARSRKWLVIGAVLTLLLVGGGGAAAFFLLGKDNAGAEQAAPELAEAIYTKIRSHEGRPMFVVTLESEDGRRHSMQVYIEALSRDPKADEMLSLHMPRIVSLLNALLSAQQYEALRTIEGKRQLQAQATERLQAFLHEKIGQPGVETVLFTNFVMQ